MSGDAPSGLPSGAPGAATHRAGRSPERLTVSAWSTAEPEGEEARRSEGFEISTIREGSGILRLEKEVHGFSKGDLLVIAPGRLHSVIARDTRGVRLLTAWCPEAFAARALAEETAVESAGESAPLEVLRCVGPVIRSEARAAALGAALLHQIETLKEGRGRGGELRLRARLLDLMGLLIDHGTEQSSDALPGPYPRTRRRDLIAGLIEAMRRADVSDLTVEDAAQGLNLSVRHFRRLFREQTGRSFHEFLTELRVEHAKHLLLQSDQKIIEVAWDTGYGSLSQFNLVFKKMTGVSPGVFRARHRVRG